VTEKTQIGGAPLETKERKKLVPKSAEGERRGIGKGFAEWRHNLLLVADPILRTMQDFPLVTSLATKAPFS
jgi:hypothetical protein